MVVNRGDFLANSKQGVGGGNERAVITDGDLLHLPADPLGVDAKKFGLLVEAIECEGE